MRNRLPAVAPSRAEMDRRNAPLYAARAAAARQVDAALTVPGATLRGLYDAACAVRDDERDCPAIKAFRAELMGRLRRARSTLTATRNKFAQSEGKTQYSGRSVLAPRFGS